MRRKKILEEHHRERCSAPGTRMTLSPILTIILMMAHMHGVYGIRSVPPTCTQVVDGTHRAD